MAVRYAYSTQTRDTLRAVINGVISNSPTLKNSLGKIPDITNMILAQMWLESRWRNLASSRTKLNASKTAGAGRDYWNSSPVQAALRNGSQISYLNQGLQAFGIMQVMGWNITKGASSSGKQVLEAFPECRSLLINPGESAYDKLVGDANVTNAVLAGCFMLHSKLIRVKQSGTEYLLGSRTFSSPQEAMFGAYLGFGKDKNGTTTEFYFSSICKGRLYQLVNSPGFNPKTGKTTGTVSGPAIVAVNQTTSNLPGCKIASGQTSTGQTSTG